ncbi:hypothetical protein DSM05_05325 [Pseudomonas sp. FW305-3-2-15-E-TSA4]|nr:hypothetical protein [Pseudomonas sp. FW305-3-2-15-E-TSA4]
MCCSRVCFAPCSPGFCDRRPPMSMTAEPIDATDRYVGDRLSELRREMGLNLAELARTSAISIAELSAIEAGRGKVYSATLWRLCRALHADLDDVLPPRDLTVSGRA